MAKYLTYSISHEIGVRGSNLLLSGDFELSFFTALFRLSDDVASLSPPRHVFPCASDSRSFAHRLPVIYTVTSHRCPCWHRFALVLFFLFHIFVLFLSPLLRVPTIPALCRFLFVFSFLLGEVLFLDWLARSCGGLAVDCLTMYGRPKWSTSLCCIHPCHSLHGYSSHYSFIFSHSLLRVGGTGTINASSSLVYFCFSWILCFGVVHLYPSCAGNRGRS